MWTAAVVLLASSMIALAPQNAPGGGAAEREAMKKLAFIVGEWTGEGKVLAGPGAGEKSAVVEKAEMKLDGIVLVLEGLGKRKAADGTVTGEIVHNAFGVITWDAKKGAYSMRAIKSDGAAVDAEAKFEGDKFIWGFEVPNGGRIRYTITLPEGRWHEFGEYSPDGGKTWMPVFEMTLEKTKAAAAAR